MIREGNTTVRNTIHLILYICVQKQLTQGMTVGGLKG